MYVFRHKNIWFTPKSSKHPLKIQNKDIQIFNKYYDSTFDVLLFEKKPKNIFEDLSKKKTWIGSNSTILPGITVGENSIVATGSIVTRDVVANTIVGGNPAKFISKLEDKTDNI